MIGKTGVGKSALGNSILGREVFVSSPNASSVTKSCKKGIMYDKREISVIDTPGILDTSTAADEIKEEIVRCIQISSPGPHAFLLVMQIGRFTTEEQNAVKALQKLFGEEASRFMIVVFTHGDELKDQTIAEYVRDGHPKLHKVVQSCGSRYLVFNNNKKNEDQVRRLLVKIDEMVAANGGGHFTQEMYEEVEQKIQQQQQLQISRQQAELKSYDFSFLQILCQRIILYQQILTILDETQ